MSARLIIGSLFAFMALLGCASGFRQISPGMTSQQVNELMGGGPSKAQEFNDGSVAWFYGENACVRMRENVVVAKEVTEDRGGISTPWGGMSQERIAQCAPAGQEVDSTRTNIYTPLGTISAPNQVINDASKGASSK